jgi:hypothetical protein
MSTSDAWGIPLRRPLPDIVGFSYYLTVWNAKAHHYTTAGHMGWWHRVRAYCIGGMLQRHSFIHELQCEPWAPKGIWEVSNAEQDKSMSVRHIRRTIAAARKTGLYPIDIWGAEWWYWRHLQGDDSIWNAVRQSLTRR